MHRGSLKIDGSDLSNTEIAAYGEERLKDADVAELTATVNAAYEKAKTDDPALAEFLSGLGEESDSSKQRQKERYLPPTITATCARAHRRMQRSSAALHLEMR